MNLYRHFILLLCIIAGGLQLQAQDDKKTLAGTELFRSNSDSLKASEKKTNKKFSIKDTLHKHDPRIATRRSAIIPGWGQAYNREYWKIPIVYGILAIPTTLYFYNNSLYKKTKFAFEARYKEAYQNDPSDVASIDPQLKNLSITSLQSYRNSFRRDRDYSILWFLLAWGLQVADATVFGHLKDFDVSSDLSMHITPVFSPITKTPGIGLTLNLKNPSHKLAISR